MMVISDSVLERDWLPSIRRPRVDGLDFRAVARLPDKGLVALGYWDLGFRNVTNSKRPITKGEDLSGLKLRVIPNPVFLDTFKAFGANPVPMPLAELYTALEMKTVDAQEHPIGVLWSAKLYEVQKHLSLTYHAYSALLVVMNKQKFESLSPANQKAIIEAAREAGQYQRKLNNDNIASK